MMTTWAKGVGAGVHMWLSGAVVVLPACALDAHAVPGSKGQLDTEPGIEQALRCLIELPEDPGVDLDAVGVVIRRAGADAVAVRQDLGAPCGRGAEGWQFNYDLTAIRLCGPTCDALRADRSMRIELVLGEHTRERE